MISAKRFRLNQDGPIEGVMGAMFVIGGDGVFIRQLDMTVYGSGDDGGWLSRVRLTFLIPVIRFQGRQLLFQARFRARRWRQLIEAWIARKDQPARFAHLRTSTHQHFPDARLRASEIRRPLCSAKRVADVVQSFHSWVGKLMRVRPGDLEAFNTVRAASPVHSVQWNSMTNGCSRLPFGYFTLKISGLLAWQKDERTGGQAGFLQQFLTRGVFNRLIFPRPNPPAEPRSRSRRA